MIRIVGVMTGITTFRVMGGLIVMKEYYLLEESRLETAILCSVLGRPDSFADNWIN